MSQASRGARGLGCTPACDGQAPLVSSGGSLQGPCPSSRTLPGRQGPLISKKQYHRPRLLPTSYVRPCCALRVSVRSLLCVQCLFGAGRPSRGCRVVQFLPLLDWCPVCGNSLNGPPRRHFSLRSKLQVLKPMPFSKIVPQKLHLEAGTLHTAGVHARGWCGRC